MNTHLSEVVDRFGTGDGTRDVVALIEAGLKAANDAQQAERAAQGKAVKTNPYVTDAAACTRKVWFSLTGEPETEPLTTDSYINFGVGHAVEDWLGQVIEAQGVQCIREVRVAIPHNGTEVSGRIDFLFVASGKLIELKTTSSRNMAWLLKRNTPDDKHVKQANLYLHASHEGALIVGDEPLPPLEAAYLVYVVKDATRREPPVHSWKVPYDRAEAIGDLTRLASIAAQAEQGHDPGIPFGFDAKKFPCSYCSYRARCWG